MNNSKLLICLILKPVNKHKPLLTMEEIKINLMVYVDFVEKPLS